MVDRESFEEDLSTERLEDARKCEASQLNPSTDVAAIWRPDIGILVAMAVNVMLCTFMGLQLGLHCHTSRDLTKPS